VNSYGKKARHLPASTYHAYAASYYEPTWSPDGRRLAFIGDTDLGQVGYTWIEVRHLAGGRFKTLNLGFHGIQYPAWSPNGRQIAFDTFEEGELELVTVSGTSGP
jgi:Tol biopolymer transport system component